MMKTLRPNLVLLDGKVYSYDTHVATIRYGYLQQLGYWSRTTQRHINFVADEYNLTLIKPPKDEQKNNK